MFGSKITTPCFASSEQNLLTSSLYFFEAHITTVLIGKNFKYKFLINILH